MIIKNNLKNVVCVVCAQNIAYCVLTFEKKRKIELPVCKSCLQQIYAEAAQFVVPKNIRPIYKPNKEGVFDEK